METLQKIYIAYLGVLAVFVCFIAWLAVKLRAERINRIRIEKEKQAAETKIHNLEYDFKSAKDSLASYVSLHENSQKIIELSKAEITKLEERINRQSDIIKELEQDKENLINCISRTGIRDVKGVVRKCNIGEIQSVISGNHPILKPKPVKVKFNVKDAITDTMNKVMKEGMDKFLKDEPKNYKIDVNVMEQPIIMADSPTTDGGVESKQVELPKPTRDWSVPQAFPEGYIPTKKIKAVRVIDNNGHIQVGTKGLINPDGTSCPVFRYKNEPHSEMCSSINYLAPINPLDHPEHPQFKMK